MGNHHSIGAVMGRMEPFINDLDRIPRIAHATYRSYKPEHLIEHDLRTQANCIYVHMVAEAERTFEKYPNVRKMDLGGLLIWLFEDHTAVRFKKMDDSGKSRNYQTKQAKAFDSNLQLAGLPPAPTRIAVGYLLDPTALGVERTQIARANGKLVDWCAALVPTELREAGEAGWHEITRQARFTA